MAPKDVSIVLDVVITFDEAEREIADCGEDRFKESDEKNPIPFVDGKERKNRMASCSQDQAKRGSDNKANDDAPVEAFPSFLRRDSFVELVFPKIDAAEISSDIVEDRTNEDEKEKLKRAKVFE